MMFCVLNAHMFSLPSFQVASAAFPFLMRLGCGGFVSGFRSGLPEDDGKYAVAQVAGEFIGAVVSSGGGLK